MFCRSVEEAYFRSLLSSLLPGIARSSGYPVTSEAALTRAIFDSVTAPAVNVVMSDLEDEQLVMALKTAERLATGDTDFARKITAQSHNVRRQGRMSRV